MTEWLETLKKLGTAAMDNVGFLIISILIVAAIIVLAKVAEKIADKKHGLTEEKMKSKTKNMVIMAMLSAIAIILHMFKIPLPFLPGFYKLEFSELPIIIGAFTLGPAAGVVMEFIKILLNLLIDGTTTAFIGELANFLMGCSFVVTASTIYYFKKTKKNAMIGLLLGLVVGTVCGCLMNAYLLLPAYGKAFHMEISALVAMGTALNEGIKSLFTFIILATAPFNIIKFGGVTLLTMLLYKPISRILKGR